MLESYKKKCCYKTGTSFQEVEPKAYKPNDLPVNISNIVYFFAKSCEVTNGRRIIYL